MNVRIIGKPILRGFRGTSIAEAHWEESQSCQLCGHVGNVRDVASVESPDGRASVLAACVNCEFAFLRRRPTASWFASFYSAEWDYARRAGTPLTAKLAASTRVLNFCRSWVPRGRVFEIGAGLGTSLRAFREAGYAVSGIEPSEHRAHFVQTVMDLPCRGASIEEVPVGETFDLVYLNHVLEHVFDPTDAITRAASLLESDGWLYVAVPNLWNEWPPQTAHYIPHVSVFTQNALERLLARCGLKVVRVELLNDIQVLAQKVTDHIPAPASSSPEFLAQLSQLMVNGFGDGRGRRALVSFPTGEHGYRKLRMSPFWMPVLRAGLLVESRLPAGLSRRVVPDLLRRRVRAVKIESSGSLALPLRIVHEVPGFEAWVK